MASSNGAGAGVVQAKLGLVGASMNAMALIAPGAFLWITYQLQAAATAPSGAVVASDMWIGIVLALIVCFLTALSYAQLAKIYPEAGFASCAYFAEKAWLDAKGQKRSGPTSAARISKLATGWSAHLFYWAYSGVMAAMMATMIGYIYNQFTGHDLSIVNMAIICVVFTIVTGYIAYRGITGSTFTAIGINIIQWGTLVIFSGLAIWYRIANPAHVRPLGILRRPRYHQAPYALRHPRPVDHRHTDPRRLRELHRALRRDEERGQEHPESDHHFSRRPGGLRLSLRVFCRELHGERQARQRDEQGDDDRHGGCRRIQCALGDLVQLLGNSLIPGIGFGLMITMAVTVAIAIIGTTLSAMNTAMRITAGIADSRELPSGLSFIHPNSGPPTWRSSPS